MARIDLRLRFRMVGFDELEATLQSIGGAFDNAHAADGDIDLTIDARREALIGNGMVIAGVSHSELAADGFTHAITIKPTASMVLFISTIMTMLPSRARVKWVGGWPHIHCPPHDDRDVQDDLPPLLPRELEPA